MSVVCQECRRLVRANTIYDSEGTYFCSRCQKTFKLPKSYYLRSELEIPILPNDTRLKIIKNDEKLLIEFPLNLFTFSFRITSVIFFFSLAVYFSQILETNSYQIPTFLIYTLLAFFISIFVSSFKKSLLFKENSIYFYKKIFWFSFKKKSEMRNVIKIKEIIIKNQGEVNHGTYIEISFENEEYWELGNNLSEKDTKYVLAELKLAYAYSISMV